MTILMLAPFNTVSIHTCTLMQSFFHWSKVGKRSASVSFFNTFVILFLTAFSGPFCQLCQNLYKCQFNIVPSWTHSSKVMPLTLKNTMNMAFILTSFFFSFLVKFFFFFFSARLLFHLSIILKDSGFVYGMYCWHWCKRLGLA